jgi:hypothetical protein
MMPDNTPDITFPEPCQRILPADKPTSLILHHRGSRDKDFGHQLRCATWRQISGWGAHDEVAHRHCRRVGPFSGR